MRKVTLKEMDFTATNALKPVAFKKFELSDFDKVGKKATSDMQLTLANKKTVKLGDYLSFLNKAEQKLNSYGFSIRNKAKHPLTMTSKSNVSEADFAKQRAHISNLMTKVTPATEQKASAIVSKYTKANLSNSSKSIKINDVHIAKWQQANSEHFTKYNQKITPAETKLLSELQPVFKKLTATPVKGQKYADSVAIVKKELTSAHEFINGTKISTSSVSTIANLFKSWNWNYTQPWNWQLGNQGSVEAYVNGNYEVEGYATMFSQNLHVKAATQAGGYIFGNKFDLFDSHAELTSASFENTSTGQVQLSATFLGNDIFTPLNQSLPADFQIINADYPYDVPLLDVTVPILFFGVDVGLATKGDFKANMNFLLAPTTASINPALKISCTIYATVGVSLLDEVELDVSGTLNLINESFNLYGSVTLSFANTPELIFDYYANDTLSLLGGEIDIIGKMNLPNFPDVWNLSWQQVADYKLFSWPDWTPINGDLIYPTEKIIPLK